MIIHPSGTDLKVWVEALATDGSTEYKSTVASLTAFGSTNGGTPALLTGVTAEFNTDMDMFLVTIPASQLPANGNNFFAVVDWEGIIDVKIEAYITDIHTLAAIKTQVDTAISDAGLVTKIDTVDTVVDGIATALETPANFMADVSSLATSAEITALNDLSAQQVWEYATRTLTAIPTGTATATALSAAQGDITSIKSTVEGISVVGGTGAEKVIPRTYYELSAVANTITLSSPYDTITEEQIISICDLTTGDVIYSCEIPIRHTISVSSGVITFAYDNNSIAAEDILQIIVNQV